MKGTDINMKIAGEKTSYTQKLALTPNYLMIEPTNKCNLRCQMCSREELTDIGDMDYELFLKIMGELPEIKTVKFQGLGEAYLAKDAIKMLEYCKERNIDVVSITNCLWNHIDIPYLMTLLKHMYISYHAADEDTYKLVCGGGKWELLHENIKKIIANKADCEVVFNCVLSQLNYRQAEKVVIKASEMGVNYVRFQIMQNWTSEGEELYSGLADLKRMDKNQLTESLQKAYDTARQYNVIVDLVGNENFDYTHCIWPFERTYINKNGDVLVCHMRPTPNYKIGNIRRSSFEEIWHSKEISEIREKLSKNMAPAMCVECPYIYAAEELHEIRSALKT